MARQIARLDDTGILISVEDCDDDEWKTDPIAKTVKLDEGNDVYKMIKQYRWNFHHNTFDALSIEPLDVAERDTSELVDGLIEAVEDIESYLEALSDLIRDKSNKRIRKIRLSPRTRRTFKEFRRHSPRKKQPSFVTDEITLDMDLVVQ